MEGLVVVMKGTKRGADEVSTGGLTMSLILIFAGAFSVIDDPVFARFVLEQRSFVFDVDIELKKENPDANEQDERERGNFLRRDHIYQLERL